MTVLIVTLWKSSLGQMSAQGSVIPGHCDSGFWPCTWINLFPCLHLQDNSMERICSRLLVISSVSLPLGDQRWWCRKIQLWFLFCKACQWYWNILVVVALGESFNAGGILVRYLLSWTCRDFSFKSRTWFSGSEECLPSMQNTPWGLGGFTRGKTILCGHRIYRLYDIRGRKYLCTSL